jgi:type IV pilus assembly protein PilB
LPSSSYIDLERDVLEPSAVSILQIDVWRRLRAIGVSRSGDVLIVAMADPDDERALRELELRTGLRIFAAKAEEETILDAIDRSHEDG